MHQLANCLIFLGFVFLTCELVFVAGAKIPARPVDQSPAASLVLPVNLSLRLHSPWVWGAGKGLPRS